MKTTYTSGGPQVPIKCVKCKEEFEGRNPIPSGWGLSYEKKEWKCPKCREASGKTGIYGTGMKLTKGKK